MRLNKTDCILLLDQLEPLNKRNFHRFQGVPSGTAIPSFKLFDHGERPEQTANSTSETLLALTQALDLLTDSLKSQVIPANEINNFKQVVRVVESLQLQSSPSDDEQKLQNAVERADQQLAANAAPNPERKPPRKKIQRPSVQAVETMRKMMEVIALNNEVKALQEGIEQRKAQLPLLTGGPRKEGNSYIPPKAQPGTQNSLDKQGVVHRNVNYTFVSQAASPGSTAKISDRAVDAKLFLIQKWEKQLSIKMLALASEFITAVHLQDLPVINILLEKNQGGFAPLMYAVRQNNQDLSFRLLQTLSVLDGALQKNYTADVLQDIDKRGNNVLMIAALDNRSYLCEQLVEGIKNNPEAIEKAFLQQNNEGNNIYMIAIKHRHMDILQTISAPNITTPAMYIAAIVQVNKQGNNLFMLAALNGDIDSLQSMLKNTDSKTLVTLCTQVNNEGNNLIDIIHRNPKLSAFLKNQKLIDANIIRATSATSRDALLDSMSIESPDDDGPRAPRR